MARIRHADDEKEAERIVDELTIQGYDVTNRGESGIKVRSRNHGTLVAHTIIAVLTLWWTAGLGNAAYALYRRRQSTDEIVVRIEEENESVED